LKSACPEMVDFTLWSHL